MKTTATAIAALLALAAAANAAHTATAPAARIPFMRGMNLCGFYGDYLENSTSADTPTSAQRYADLKAKGFDHIRLPVDFRKFANYDESSGTCTLDKREWNRYAWKYVSSGWRRQPALGADHGPGSPPISDRSPSRRTTTTSRLSSTATTPASSRTRAAPGPMRPTRARCA